MCLILFLIFLTGLFYALNKLPEMFECQHFYLFKGGERWEELFAFSNYWIKSTYIEITPFGLKETL